MSELKLEAKKRDITKKTKELLSMSRIPSVIYGPTTGSFPIDVDYQSFRKVLTVAKKGKVIKLSVEGKDYDVLVKSYDFDPIYDTFIHVDFLAVDQKSPVIAEIPLVFEGDSKAIRLGGVLRQELKSIKVKALVKNLPESFLVDISKLEHFKASIRVSNIETPSTVEVLTHDLIVASIIVPRSVAAAANTAAKAEAKKK